MNLKTTVGQAWIEVLAALQEASEAVVKRTIGDPAAEAVGHRFVSRLFASMRLFALEQDASRPSFVPVMSTQRKFFADNPDTTYHRTPVRADLSYRITGTRGSCEYLSFCVYAVSEEGTSIVSNLADSDLELDENGHFEIMVSVERPADAPNWMALAPGVRSLVARQYFLDRDTEIAPTYSIECITSSDQSVPPEMPYIGLRDSFSRAMKATLLAHDAWSKQPNQVSFESGAADVINLFPTPDNQYAGGWFALEPEHAVVVTVQPPDCRYWSVQLLSPWLESVDSDVGTAIINKRNAQLTGDNRIRFVIATTDPGEPNWLHPGQLQAGCFVFRWMQAEQAPAKPTCELIAL